MIYRILFVLAVALACCIPCDAYAGPLGLFPNLDGHRVAAVARGAGKAAKRSARAVKAVAPGRNNRQRARNRNDC